MQCNPVDFQVVIPGKPDSTVRLHLGVRHSSTDELELAVEGQGGVREAAERGKGTVRNNGA